MAWAGPFVDKVNCSGQGRGGGGGKAIVVLVCGRVRPSTCHRVVGNSHILSRNSVRLDLELKHSFCSLLLTLKEGTDSPDNCICN
jgi:hypothetical protein